MRYLILALILGWFIGNALAQTVSYTCTTPTSCVEQDVYSKPIKSLDLTARINSLTQTLKNLQSKQASLQKAQSSAQASQQNNAVTPPSNNIGNQSI